MIWKYFLPFGRLPFYFVDCFFCCVEAFQFDVVLLIFAFMAFAFGVISKKSLPRPMSRFSPMLSSRSFMVQVLFFFFFLQFLFIYLFMAVLGPRFCARALSSCGKAGATLHRGARASHHRGLSRCGAQAPDVQAQQLWLTGPAAPRHVGSSQTRARTRVPRISRQTLNHCATREAPRSYV